MPTQSQKNARDKWDKQHMTHITCKLTREKAMEFKAACAKLETVPNRVMLQAVADTIEKAGRIESQE